MERGGPAIIPGRAMRSTTSRTADNITARAARMPARAIPLAPAIAAAAATGAGVAAAMVAGVVAAIEAARLDCTKLLLCLRRSHFRAILD